MLADTFLMPVHQADIEIGKPLGFALYDGDRNLLFNPGETIGSVHQLERLLENGLFQERNRPDYSAIRQTGKDARAEKKKPKDERPAEETLSFDAVNLMPGDSVQLQPLMEGLNERWVVRVIGHLKHKSLMVTAPVVDGKFVFVKEGQPFLVRAFSGLNVCAFKSRVLKSQLQPFPYMHLAWASSVQAMRIRKAMRAPVDIIVAVHETDAGHQIGAGKIVDISVAGAKLLSPTRLGNEGQTIWLLFKVKLADMEEYVKTSAVIRTVGEETDEKGMRIESYGVEFGELSQTERLIVMNQVYQHLLNEHL